MDEIRIITLKNGQVIVGKPIFDGPGSTRITHIQNPRAIVPAQSGLQLMELFGRPDELVLFDNALYMAENKDNDIFRTYIQSTTSLVVPN